MCVVWNWAPWGKPGGILVGVNNDVFDVIQVEIGVYFFRILVFDKISNSIRI